MASRCPACAFFFAQKYSWNVCPTLTRTCCTEWLLPPVDALHPVEAALGLLEGLYSAISLLLTLFSGVVLDLLATDGR